MAADDDPQKTADDSAQAPNTVIPITQARKKKQDPGWRARLVTRRGQLAATVMNAIAIFANDDTWAGVLGFNLLTETIVTQKSPPWHPTDRTADDGPGQWRDIDTTRAASWLARMYDLLLGHSIVREAIDVVARKNAFHPIRDWLTSLTWDGKPRADTLLIRHAFVADTAYARAVTGKWLISAVARAMRPGCQADHVLVVEGEQRIGKSSLFRVLAGNDEWYCETGVDFGSREAMQTISRKWIVELAELDSISRSELSRTKQFITTQVDTFRLPYAREVIDRPRACILAGTINDFEYLKDDTGGGRWWGVRSLARATDRIDLRAVASERGQIFAECYRRFTDGEQWHLTDPTLLAETARQQEARRVIDPWAAPVLRALLNTKRQKDGVTTHYLLCHVLSMPIDKLSRSDEMRMGNLLRTFGWAKSEVRDSVMPGCRLYRLTDCEKFADATKCRG